MKSMSMNPVRFREEAEHHHPDERLENLRKRREILELQGLGGKHFSGEESEHSSIEGGGSKEVKNPEVLRLLNRNFKKT